MLHIIEHVYIYIYVCVCCLHMYAMNANSFKLTHHNFIFLKIEFIGSHSIQNKISNTYIKKKIFSFEQCFQ